MKREIIENFKEVKNDMLMKTREKWEAKKNSKETERTEVFGELLKNSG